MLLLLLLLFIWVGLLLTAFFGSADPGWLGVWLGWPGLGVCLGAADIAGVCGVSGISCAILVELPDVLHFGGGRLGFAVYGSRFVFAGAGE